MTILATAVARPGDAAFLTLKRPGLTGSLFICLYALSRIFVELFREPDPQIGYLFGGWLTMGMVLSLPMLLVGLWGIWYSGRMAARNGAGKAS